MAFAADERLKASDERLAQRHSVGRSLIAVLLLSKALELVETGVPRTTRHAATAEAPIARDPLAQ